MSSPEQSGLPGRARVWRSRVVIGVLTAVLATLLTMTGAGPAQAAVSPSTRQSVQHASTSSAAEIRAGKIRAGKIRAGKIRAGRIRAGRIRAGRIRAGKIRAGQVRAGRIRAGQVRAARVRAGRIRAGQVRAKRLRAARAHRARVLRARARANAWRYPSRRYVIAPTSYFSFPNRSSAESMAIRNRVLYTIQSTWGGSRDPRTGAARRGAGSIRITTWTIDDMAIARALVAAHRRGVSVQVVAAAQANKQSKAWRYLRKRLGTRLYRPGRPDTREYSSFARTCRGSCRGNGGTSHAKYFLFHNVGSAHVPYVVVQSSMNLTEFAYQRQWNHAQVMWSRAIYYDFLRVFKQARVGRTVSRPYHVYASGNVVNVFFPRPNPSARVDPVMQILNRVHCTGAQAGGTRGRTKIRIIQYAVYGDRGTWIARKLRSLWKRGCDVAVIYSIASRPVLSVLRNRSGRGPIPMRQSVVEDGWGNLTTYNHSKWMTITGHWGGSRRAAITFAGSANWANMAFSSDEQMQRISSASNAGRYLAAFAKIWQQKTSRVP
jgi:hypothetical protein